MEEEEEDNADLRRDLEAELGGASEDFLFLPEVMGESVGVALGRSDLEVLLGEGVLARSSVSFRRCVLVKVRLSRFASCES